MMSVYLPQASAFPKENGSRPRVVIFTQGKDPIVVASLGKVSSDEPHRQASKPGCVFGILGRLTPPGSSYKISWDIRAFHESAALKHAQ